MLVLLVNVPHQVLVHENSKEHQDSVDGKMLRILRTQNIWVLEDGGYEPQLERDQRVVNELYMDQFRANQANEDHACQTPVDDELGDVDVMVVLQLLFYQRCSHDSNHYANPPTYQNQLNILSLILLFLT